MKTHTKPPAIFPIILFFLLIIYIGCEEDPLAPLTSREREVLQLVVEGNTSASIAEILHLSPKTVDTYRSNVMGKLGIRDIPGLVKFAIKHGLTPLE